MVVNRSRRIPDGIPRPDARPFIAPATKTIPPTIAPNATTPISTDLDTKNPMSSAKPHKNMKTPSFARLTSSMRGDRRRTSLANDGSS